MSAIFLRPESAAELDRLVALYAGDANAHQRQMFGESLHAALTLDEVRALAVSFGIAADCVQQTSDRHWTLSWKADGGRNKPQSDRLIRPPNGRLNRFCLEDGGVGFGPDGFTVRPGCGFELLW